MIILHNHDKIVNIQTTMKTKLSQLILFLLLPIAVSGQQDSTSVVFYLGQSDSVEYTPGQNNFAWDLSKAYVPAYTWDSDFLRYETGLTTPLNDTVRTKINDLCGCFKNQLDIDSLAEAFDVILPLANETSESALRNLVKRAYDGTTTGSPTFTAFEGFTGASGKYINTNFNPSTQGITSTLNSISGGVYSRSDFQSTGYQFGSAIVGGNLLTLRIKSGSNLMTYAVNSTTSDTYTNGTGIAVGEGYSSAGLYAISRTASGTYSVYHNGTQREGGSIASNAVPNQNMFIFCRNVNGSPSDPTIYQLSFFFMGKGFDQPEIQKISTCFETYMDSNGKGVIDYDMADLYGGLTTRLFASQATADVFEDHGYRATFCIVRPAQYKNDATNKALFKSLQLKGHDLGYWTDISPTMVQLYDTSWVHEFLSLDAPYQNTYDSYGLPAWGIEEVITVGASRYLGLNSDIRFQTDNDVIVKPVHGTDSVIITNIPAYTDFFDFMIYMPDDPMIPEAVRGRWINCGIPNVSTPIASRKFPVEVFEYFTLTEYAGEAFNNPTNATFTTKLGLSLDKVGADYTDINIKAQYTNHKNTRARYYEYYHAIKAFEEMGLERPYVAAEPRSHHAGGASLSEAPLSQLNYLAAIEDPVNKGHTFHMNNGMRYRFSDQAAASEEPIGEIGLDNSLNINGGIADPFTGYEAFTRIVDNHARNRWMLERQDLTYTATELALWDTILGFCQTNNIPVLPLSKCAITLFDSVPPNVNIFPKIYNDIDTNDIPDGYLPDQPNSTYEQDLINGNAESNYWQFSQSGNDRFLYSRWIGGCSTDSNSVSLYAKGFTGDQIRVYIYTYEWLATPGVLYGMSYSRVTTILTKPITVDDTWQLLEMGKFNMPANAYFIDVAVNLIHGPDVGARKCGQVYIVKS